MRPQYGGSVRTSLKNAQNFAKTSKLRQNSVKVTFDTREVRPQYGDSVRTSLKNVQNLSKSSKLRQNSVKMTFDTREVWPGCAPVRGLCADLMEKCHFFAKIAFFSLGALKLLANHEKQLLTFFGFLPPYFDVSRSLA